MMKDEKREYIISCIQLNTILNMMSDDVRKKIPKEFLEEIGKHKLRSYAFKYDYSKPLDEQPINDITREMLALIYKDYLCDSEEKINYEKKLKKLIEGVK